MAVINLNNAPGAVPYVSMTDDQSNAVLINALNERTKQYENQLNAIAENEALLRQMKVRDADRAGSLVRAAKIASELDKEIQEKYAGDYASVGARKAVASRLAQERGTFSTLQQKYEEEQPYKQMYQQLKMTGQLAQKFNPATGKVEEVNPFSQSIVDAEGNLVSQTGIDYGDIRKKGDYIDYVSKNIVDPLNKRMKDLGLKYTKGPFYGTKTSIQRTKVGMSPEEAASTIDDVTAKRFLEDNPNYAFEFGSDLEKTKDFIKGIVRDKVIEQIHPNYGNVTDPLAALKYKEAHEKERSEINPPSKLIPKGATPYSLADRGFSNLKELQSKHLSGDPQATEILTMVKNKLPERIRKGYEADLKTAPKFWQKDLMKIPGYSKLNSKQRDGLAKDLNELVLGDNFIEKPDAMSIVKIAKKYGLSGYKDNTIDIAIRSLSPIGAGITVINAMGKFFAARSAKEGENLFRLVGKKYEASKGFNNRISKYNNYLNTAINEGVNYETLGASPMDTQLNKTLGTYFLQYGMKNFKPIGGSKKSSFDETTGYWDENDFKDINSGIISVEFERAGAGKPVTYKVTTKSGKSYSMQLDKSRFKDVDAFTSGLSVLTQTPEIHTDEVANAVESQITYTKPLIGKNVMIQKKSPDTFRKMVGEGEFNRLVESGLINPNEPSIFTIIDKNTGKPVKIYTNQSTGETGMASSSSMSNLIDYYNYYNGDPTFTEQYAHKLRQYKTSEKEENEYLKNMLKGSSTEE